MSVLSNYICVPRKEANVMRGVGLVCYYLPEY